MKVEIIKSSLKDMTINITKTESKDSLFKKDYFLPVKVSNSTIKHLFGFHIELEVIDVVITAENPSYQAVFMLVSSRGLIKSSSFDGVQNPQNAGALHSYQSEVEIISSTFSSYSARRSVILAIDSNITVRMSSFEANQGQAIHVSHSKVMISESLFQANRGLLGLVISAQYTSTVVIDNCQFINNSVSSINTWAEIASHEKDYSVMVYGGSLATFWKVNMTILNSQFTGNNATQTGAIMVQNSKLIVDNCTFSENKAGGNNMKDLDHPDNIMKTVGGAILAWNSELTVNKSRFDQNLAKGPEMAPNQKNITVLGGAVYAFGNVTGNIGHSHFDGNQAPQGGAIYVARNSAVTINGCTFHNNMATGMESRQPVAPVGGAIMGSDNTTIRIWNSSFKGNQAFVGGAIALEQNTSLTTNNCTFSLNNALQNDNIKQSAGGAIHGQHEVVINLIMSHFLNNSACVGGAVSLTYHTTLIVDNSTFIDNKATGIGSTGVDFQKDIIYGGGGAIYGLHDLLIDVVMSHFVNNYAPSGDGYGGAICLLSRVTVKITSSIFSDNRAFRGGAINVQRDVSIEMEHTSFHRNFGSSYKSLAGAILALERVTMDLKSSVFVNNTAGGAGAILAENDAYVHLKNTDFQNNAAMLNTGSGGAILVNYKANLHIDSTSFRNNTGYFGGAIFAQANTNITVRNTHFLENSASVDDGEGGAIAGLERIILQIDSSAFANNTALEGGSISLRENGYIVINDTSFVSNKARDSGGAIKTSVNVTVQIRTSLFDSNIAQQGGAINVNRNVSLFIIDNTFYHNTASHTSLDTWGGAINAAKNVIVYIENSEFFSNTALSSAFDGSGGAIVLADNVKTNIRNSIFDRNMASVSGGAIFLTDNIHLVLVQTSISNSWAQTVGGLDGRKNVTLEMRNCTFQNNSAKEVCDANIYTNCTVIIEDCDFIHGDNPNRISQLVHDVKVYDESDLQIVRSTFKAIGSKILFLSIRRHVTATMDSVVFSQVSPNLILLIDVKASDLYLTNCIFPQIISASTTTSLGWALITVTDNSTLHMHQCSFSMNYGPTLCSITNSSIRMDTVSIRHNFMKDTFRINGGSLYMTNSRISNNAASGHGGIIRSTASMLVLLDCIFQNNSAAGYGGVLLSLDSNISIFHCSFDNNKAKSGHGGVIILFSSHIYSTLSIMNTNFSYNQAGGYGAVLYATSSLYHNVTAIALDSCQLSENVATLGSVLYLQNSYSLRTSKCRFRTALDVIEQSSIYFVQATQNQSYLTYKTTFHKGNTSQSSHAPDFLQKAISSGNILTYNGGKPYYSLIHWETQYAAGEYLVFMH